MQKLGMVEYRKLMEEVDSMMHQPVDVMALVNKWIEELHERLEAEEKEKQEGERRQTRSQINKAGTSSTTTTTTTKPTPESRKRTCDVDDMTNLGVEPAPRNQNPQRRPRRKRYGKLQGQRSQSLKLTTLTMNRKTEKKEQAQKKLLSPGAKASGKTKKIKKTVTEDEDDDRLDDLMIMESKVPDIEEYDDDRDEDYEPGEEDDDDFQIPPLRACKPTQSSDKSTGQSKKAKPSDAK